MACGRTDVARGRLLGGDLAVIEPSGKPTRPRRLSGQPPLFMLPVEAALVVLALLLPGGRAHWCCVYVELPIVASIRR